MNSQTGKCLGLSTKVVINLGLWPTSGREKRNLAFYLRYLYPRIQPIRMVYGVFCQMINISLVWGDTTRIVEFTAALAFQVVILVRFVTLFNQRHKIKEMCETIDRLNLSKCLVDDGMKKIAKQTQLLAWGITKFILLFVMTSLSVNLPLFAVHAFITRKIPMRLWYPYDVTSTPAFELTTIFTVTTISIESLVVTVSDAIFIALMIQTIGQFKLLSYKLENIRKLTVEKIDRNNLRKKHVNNIAHMLKLAGTHNITYCGEMMPSGRIEGTIEAGSPQRDKVMLSIPGCVQGEPGSDAEKGEKWSAKLKAGNSSTQPITQKDGVDYNNTELETNLAMEHLIKECSKHHQTLLTLVKDLGIAFKVMLWQQIIFTAMGGFVMLYVTTLAPSVDATVVLFVTSMCGFYVEYFLFCWFGHIITDQGILVRDAIYDCDWFGASERFKCCMRIMIARTNKPLVIKGGGLPLSVGTCRLICRASYYFHTLLSKMFHGEKILKNRDT